MRKSPVKRSREGDKCFRCKEQGHWSADCPNKTPAKKYCRTPPSTPVTRFWGQEDGLEYSPALRVCDCGLPCPLRICTNSKNFNRPYYACTNDKCKNSFKWEDQVRREELVHVPKCACGAGCCRQYVEESGINAGRKYFACPIKKGACTFYKLNEGKVLISSDRVEERITSSCLALMDHANTTLEESVRDESLDNKRVQIGSNNVDTALNSQNRGVLSSGQLKRVRPTEMEDGEIYTSDASLVKHNKGLGHEAPEYYGSSITPVIECTDKPCRTNSRVTSVEEELQTFLISAVEIRLKQVEFMRQMSLEGITLPVSSTSCYSISNPSNLLQLGEDWMKIAVSKLDISLFEGWWGRLAYPPWRCLILPTPKPFFCCVFPSYDPILIPQSEEKPKFQPASLQILPNKQVTVMNNAISLGFATLARNLQNQLISFLELTDWHNHNSMEQEARITFAALDQLQIGCQPFREWVKKLIKCASSLAQTESSCIHEDLISHELQEHYNSKRRRFDSISRDYQMAKVAVETSRERLQSVRKEVSHVKSMLFLGEAELSCRVTENRYQETRFAKISKELEESEQACQEAFEASEEALKLFQRRKDEQNEAESAFKKARVQLRLIM